MSVTVNWFEIPVNDMSRAIEFYGAVLDEPLGSMDGPDGPMPIFPAEDGAAGALIAGEGSPSQEGVLVYLGCADIEAALARVTRAGGRVVQEKTAIGPHGFIGRFTDSEGNAMALHTPG